MKFLVVRRNGDGRLDVWQAFTTRNEAVTSAKDYLKANPDETVWVYKQVNEAKATVNATVADTENN